MIIRTAGEPDLGRAEILHELAWAAYDASIEEVADGASLAEVETAARRVDTSAVNLADTCQAAGLTPVAQPA
jgi:hypothetical protein